MLNTPIHKIFIRTDASRQLGMGHIYRCLALWEEMKDHDATIFVCKDYPVSADLYKQRGAMYETVEDADDFIRICAERQPELIIIDMLDTQRDYIESLQKTGAKVVTFEDLGEGAEAADLVVNDLYKNVKLAKHRQLSGLRNAIISPLFEQFKPVELREKVDHILITYGGTDPSHLTEHALNGLQRTEFKGHVTVILGPGRPEEGIDLDTYGLHGDVLKNVTDMPSIMKKADLALCSAGRTITELMTLGIPMLVMCQNMKELMHTHANCQYGVINLGLGTLVSVDTLANHIDLFTHHDIHSNLHERALYEISERSNHNVVERILSCLGEA